MKIMTTKKYRIAYEKAQLHAEAEEEKAILEFSEPLETGSCWQERYVEWVAAVNKWGSRKDKGR